MAPRGVRIGVLEKPSGGSVKKARLPEVPRGPTHPAEQMRAVGDVADGHVVHGHVVFGPPHFAAHLSVQFTHAIGGARGVQRQHGHAKTLLLVRCIEPA